MLGLQHPTISVSGRGRSNSGTNYGNVKRSLKDLTIKDERERLVTNIYFVVFVAFIVSHAVGVVFYSLFHEWEISTAFYFASQVLLGESSILVNQLKLLLSHADPCDPGNMYGIPEEIDEISQAFTMVYFLWGSCLIAAFHLVATTSVARDYSSTKQFFESLSPRMYFTDTTDISIDCLQVYGLRDTQKKGYERHKIRLVVAMLAFSWAIIGTICGMYFENWSFLKALYFAIGAISAAGQCRPAFQI